MTSEHINHMSCYRHGQPRRAWGWQQEWEVQEGEQARAEVYRYKYHDDDYHDNYYHDDDYHGDYHGGRFRRVMIMIMIIMHDNDYSDYIIFIIYLI